MFDVCGALYSFDLRAYSKKKKGDGENELDFSGWYKPYTIHIREKKGDTGRELIEYRITDLGVG